MEGRLERMKRYGMVMFCVLALSLAGSAAAAPIPIPKGFALEHGRVTRDGTALECEVHEVPDEIDNGIALWSVVGSGSSGLVKEGETGVIFFGMDGKSVAFIPLDAEGEYQDLIWSPDGSQLVLVMGGAGPDVTFTLFVVDDKGMKKGAKFSGLRGGLAWTDPNRFAFTRIDDVRNVGGGAVEATAFRLSAVLYDVPVEAEIVLKAADETRSYTFQSVSEDGNTLNLTELSVESPKDWDDPEKISEHAITVDVPAAG